MERYRSPTIVFLDSLIGYDVIIVDRPARASLFVFVARIVTFRSLSPWTSLIEIRNNTMGTIVNIVGEKSCSPFFSPLWPVSGTTRKRKVLLIETLRLHFGLHIVASSVIFSIASGRTNLTFPIGRKTHDGVAIGSPFYIPATQKIPTFFLWPSLRTLIASLSLPSSLLPTVFCIPQKSVEIFEFG